MSSSLKHHARPGWTCLSLIPSFQFDCFQSFSPFLFSVPVFLVPERCVLNLLLSLRSPVGPRELLPAVCLELHEPQVVLSALSVGSPLPQGVQWHRHPQWLLSVHQHSTVSNDSDFGRHAPPEGQRQKQMKDNLTCGTRGQDEQFVLCWRTSLPCILNLIVPLFILRWRSVSGSDDPVSFVFPHAITSFTYGSVTHLNRFPPWIIKYIYINTQ